MSTSVNSMKKNALKTMLVYLGATAFCIIFSNVYALYGHGVYSSSMSYMFLYPFLGGSLVFFLLWLLVPKEARFLYYRAYYNLYNSGIATLTTGSVLKGVFDIAGTSSPYTVVFFICGGLLIAAGLAGFWMSGKRYKKTPKHLSV